MSRRSRSKRRRNNGASPRASEGASAAVALVEGAEAPDASDESPAAPADEPAGVFDEGADEPAEEPAESEPAESEPVPRAEPPRKGAELSDEDTQEAEGAAAAGPPEHDASEVAAPTAEDDEAPDAPPEAHAPAEPDPSERPTPAQGSPAHPGGVSLHGLPTAWTVDGDDLRPTPASGVRLKPPQAPGSTQRIRALAPAGAPSNLLTEWCRLFFGALAHAGLTELVVSPGARSTPALLAAHRTEGLRLHIVRDERAAAFFALGIARAAERPVGLLCTSGSAPGHYLPAVMEAKADGLPLLVVTADRPPELHGIAAPQTTDQTRLFGAHAVGFVDLGMPDPHPAALAGLVRIAAQALFQATYPEPGAVQVNLRARKPLEPRPDRHGVAELGLTRKVDALLEVPPPRAFPPFMAPHAHGIDALVVALSEAKRPLIVAGPRRASARPALEAARAEAAFAFAARLGAPLLAEAGSQLRLRPCPPGVTRVDGYDRILLAPEARAALAPDLVVQLGAPPTSAPLLRALAEWPAPRWVLSERPWPDVDNRAQGVVLGRYDATLRGLEAWVAPAPASFAPKWRDADAIAWRVGAPAPWGEAAVVQAALGASPSGAAVMLGNSLAIRHVETWVRCGRDEACEVVVQRGLNGIDGLVAGAAGWVRARGTGMTLVLGDVSFLHDVSSLELGRGLLAPLVIVVIDNRGGRIFERLPLAQVAESAMEAFVTSPQADIEGLADAYGAAPRRAQDAHEVAALVARAHRTRGVTVIRALVPEHEASEALDRLTAEMRRAFTREDDE